MEKTYLNMVTIPYRTDLIFGVYTREVLLHVSSLLHQSTNRYALQNNFGRLSDTYWPFVVPTLQCVLQDRQPLAPLPEMPEKLLEKVEQDIKELTDEQIEEDLDKEFLKAIFWNPFRSTEPSWQYCMFN